MFFLRTGKKTTICVHWKYFSSQLEKSPSKSLHVLPWHKPCYEGCPTLPLCAGKTQYQPARTNLSGLWELHNCNDWECKSWSLWYLSKLKTSSKPSRQFFSACLLCMTPTFNIDKDSGWYVQMMCWWHDNLSVILSVFNSTLDLFGKKIMRWVKKLIEAGWLALCWSDWVIKMVPSSFRTQ